MHVMKFGGASFRKPEGFEQFLTAAQNPEDKPLLIVISAFADSTRQLYKAARTSAEPNNYEEALKILDNVINYHFELIEGNFKSEVSRQNIKDLILKSSEKINLLLKGISITGEATPRAIDHIISFGEHFALYILCKLLEENEIEHKRISSTNFMRTDSNYGAAKPQLEHTRQLVEEILKPALNNHGIAVTQGFVGCDGRGRITTMGIESSNMTAALLAGLIGANELTVWTDVEGVKTADPAYVKNVRHIEELNYTQALKAAHKGLKLFYPSMIEYAEEFNTSIIIKSAFKPEGLSTRIHKDAEDMPLPMIISIDNIKPVSFSRENANDNVFIKMEGPGFVYSEFDGIEGKAYFRSWNGYLSNVAKEKLKALHILNFEFDRMIQIVMKLKNKYLPLKDNFVFRPGIDSSSSLIILPAMPNFEAEQYLHEQLFSDSLVNPERLFE